MDRMQSELSVALAGLDGAALGVSPGVRSLVAWAADGATGGSPSGVAAGRSRFAAVQLDARDRETRPRELGRSARRDLAAMLRRRGVECSGIDLWIPPEHFADGATADRAVEAVIGAIELAAELRSLEATGLRNGPAAIAVCVTMGGAPEGVRAAIEATAQTSGVAVADFAITKRDGVTTPATGVVAVGIQPGIDAAAVLSSGGDPAAEVARLGRGVGGVRLTDIASWGGRVAPGSKDGRLDLLAMRVAVMTGGFADAGGRVVLDLRGLQDQGKAAQEAMERWDAAAGSV